MSLLDKEPVQRVEKILKEFDESQNIIVLETSARTALEAASSLGCEVGAIVKSLPVSEYFKDLWVLSIHPQLIAKDL